MTVSISCIFAGESLVYALKFIIETCLCYKKSKLIKWMNVANIMAGALIIATYALTFNTEPQFFSFTAYSWISYICVAAVTGIGIASIVILILDAKKAKNA